MLQIFEAEVFWIVENTIPTSGAEMQDVEAHSSDDTFGENGSSSFFPVLPEQRLCFLHVPKAGGTSIAAFFGKFFHVRRINALLSLLDLLKTPLSELQETHLLRSHALRTAHRLCSRDFRTISFVRHPVERTISHFKHVRTLADRLPEYQMFAGMDLQAFLASEVGRAEVMNLQCSLYGIDEDLATPMLVSPHGWRRPALMDRLCARQTLEDALAFVEALDYVGTIENWTACTTDLCMDMDWPLLDDTNLQRLNENHFDLGNVPKTTISEIERLVPLDLELYDAIRAREDKLAEGLGDRIAESRERYRGKHERRRTAYYWRFDAPFYAGGIYQRESALLTNAFGREDSGAEVAGQRVYSYWCGEDMFFDVWLEPGRAYRLRACIDVLAGFQTEAVELSVNGTALDQGSWLSVHGGDLLVDVQLPMAPIEPSGFARIRFSCPGQGKRPSKDDSRLLALHLQWIELFPSP